MDEKPNNIEDIDVNSPEFYEKVQNEIESDMARMKKGVEVVMNLRTMAKLECRRVTLSTEEKIVRRRQNKKIKNSKALKCFKRRLSNQLIEALLFETGRRLEKFEFKLRRKKNAVEAAEIEVETAALFHDELWYDLLIAMNDSHDNSGDEESEETQEDSLATNTPTDIEVNTEAVEAQIK